MRNMMPKWMIKGLMSEHPYEMGRRFEFISLEKSLWIVEYNHYSAIPYDESLDYKDNHYQQYNKSITTALVKLIAIKHQGKVYYRHEVPNERFSIPNKVESFEFNKFVSKELPDNRNVEFDFSKQEDLFFIKRMSFRIEDIEEELEKLNVRAK